MGLPPKKRRWVIEAQEGELDQQEIVQALAEAALIVQRVGGVVMMSSYRAELDPEAYGVVVPDVWATTALVLQWEPYSPPAPEPDPEPELAGAAT